MQVGFVYRDIKTTVWGGKGMQDVAGNTIYRSLGYKATCVRINLCVDKICAGVTTTFRAVTMILTEVEKKQSC